MIRSQMIVIKRISKKIWLLGICLGVVILSEAKNLNASGMLHFVQHDILFTPRDPNDPKRLL